MAQTLISRIRALFEGDPGIRKVADDPVLSAEILLLLRMILADGSASEDEMATLRRICREAFGIGEESIDGVIRYLDDFGYETNGAQAVAMFQDLDVERRRLLARHMADLAKADAQLAEQEIRLLKRTLQMLDLGPGDVIARR